jgi:hypothetical protein
MKIIDRLSKSLLTLATGLVLVLSLSAFAPAAVSVASADTPAANTACSSFNQLSSGVSCDQSQNGKAGESTIGKIAGNIIDVLSLIVGMAAVVLIIYAGLKYVTSGGDPNGTGSAKGALVGAMTGLVVAALAQVLVHFVLNQTNG